MAAYSRAELRSYIRTMYSAASTVELRNKWLTEKTNAITTAATSSASGKQLQSQSSAGFSASFTQGSASASKNQMALYDRLWDFVDYPNVSAALAAVPPAIRSIRGDSRYIRL